MKNDTNNEKKSNRSMRKVLLLSAGLGSRLIQIQKQTSVARHNPTRKFSAFLS
jgi:hypothetical protein